MKSTLALVVICTALALVGCQAEGTRESQPSQTAPTTVVGQLPTSIPPPGTSRETPAAEDPAVPQPEITLFEVLPDGRLAWGDTATVRWSATDAMHLLLCYAYVAQLDASRPFELREAGGECFGGIPAECHLKDADGDYLYPPGSDKCSFLPPEGAQEVVLSPLDEGEVYYVRFWIQAMSGVQDPDSPYGLRAPILEATAEVFRSVSCTHQWFMSRAPQWCPAAPPWSAEATAQEFENGVMIFLPAHDAAPNQVHAYYTHEGEMRLATWYNVTPQPPAADQTPPAGLSAPGEQFYPVWVGPFGATSLRATMGWAKGETFVFTWVSQAEQGPDNHDHRYVRMPDEAVYRLDPMDHTWALWE